MGTFITKSPASSVMSRNRSQEVDLVVFGAFGGGSRMFENPSVRVEKGDQGDF